MNSDDVLDQMLSRLPIPPEMRETIRQMRQQRATLPPVPQVIPRAPHQIFPGMGKREWIIATYGAMLAAMSAAANQQPGQSPGDEPDATTEP
jgi:hypothetical protein